MVYRGRMKGGVVVLEEGACLPENAEVDVTPVVPAPLAPEDDPIYRIYELAEPGGVPDLAQNIDHYLYGHPKVTDEQP